MNNPYYYPYPGSMYDPALQKALELIRRAVAGETHDRLFYEYLLSQAPNAREREIITSIRDDEMKHYRMFREIYRGITGTYPTPLGSEQFEKPANYLAGIEEALFGELGAVEMYREIYFGMPNLMYRDMLFEIITDEQKHATKYNYIFTRNYAH